MEALDRDPSEPGREAARFTRQLPLRWSEAGSNTDAIPSRLDGECSPDPAARPADRPARRSAAHDDGEASKPIELASRRSKFVCVSLFALALLTSHLLVS